MPRVFEDDDVPIQKGPFRSRRGEAPLTWIRDLYDAIEVRVLTCPRPSDTEWIRSFISATWADSPDEVKEDAQAFESIFEKGRLWQAQEILPFMVLFNNVTRIATHHLVRQRVGVTFSQQCSGDSDWRHHDVLLPRSLVAVANEDLVEEVIESAIGAKKIYADLVDAGVSVRDARYALPQSLSTFLFMFAPASTIIQMYKRRACTMAENWEMIVIMEKMREALLVAAPYLKNALVPHRPGECWWNKAHFSVRTNLYMPDAEHDPKDYRWRIEDFEHACTAKEISRAEYTSRPSRFYIRTKETTEEEWRKQWEATHQKTSR